MLRHPSMNKVWPFIFFFLFFAAVAAYTPFLVLYYQSLGFSGSQIGLLTGIPPLVTMASVPVWTRVADRTNRYRLFMSISLLGAAGAVALYPFLTSFAAVLVVTLFANLFFAPAFAFANNATMFMLGDEKDLYGRLRLGGTIGFGAAAAIAGVLVDRFGLPLAFWLGASFLVASFLVSLKLVNGQEETEETEDARGINDLLRQPVWIVFLLLAFIAGVGMAAVSNYFFPYMGELGASETAMGMAVAVGTIAEIPVMLLANRFIGRFGDYGTSILATAFTGLRLVLFGLVDSTAAVLLIQVINGLGTPLFMVAGVHYADQLAPPGLHATSQGLLNAVMLGVGVAVGGFLSGLLLVAMGAQALLLITGLFMLVVLGIAVFLQQKFA